MLRSKYTTARDALKNKISEVIQLFSTTNTHFMFLPKQLSILVFFFFFFLNNSNQLPNKLVKYFAYQN